MRRFDLIESKQITVASSMRDRPTSMISPESITTVDVLCGRGGRGNSHPGNRVYRRLICARKCLYKKLDNRQKSLLVRSIVLAVNQQGGRFLKFDKVNQSWIPISDEESSNKTAQAFREKDPKPWSCNPDGHGASPDPADDSKVECATGSTKEFLGSVNSGSRDEGASTRFSGSQLVGNNVLDVSVTVGKKISPVDKYVPQPAAEPKRSTSSQHCLQVKAGIYGVEQPSNEVEHEYKQSGLSKKRSLLDDDDEENEIQTIGLDTNSLMNDEGVPLPPTLDLERSTSIKVLEAVLQERKKQQCRYQGASHEQLNMLDHCPLDFHSMMAASDFLP